MTYEQYRAAVLAFADSQQRVADAARVWALATDEYAKLQRQEAENREPWAAVETPARWAAREAVRQDLRLAYRMLEVRLKDEKRALEVLDAAKLAYYEACAKAADADEEEP